MYIDAKFLTRFRAATRNGRRREFRLAKVDKLLFGNKLIER